MSLVVRFSKRFSVGLNQRGYVLGVVLGAMVVGLSLITALLGLSFTTQRAAITQQELARDRRAADGALEVSVREMESNYTLGADPCGPVPQTVPMELAEQPAGVVTLGCDQILDPTPNAAGDVKIVGDTGSTLTHDGSSALNVVGALTVRKGATFSGSADPMLQVAGEYRQGDSPCPAGIRDAVGEPACGDSDAQGLTFVPTPADRPDPTTSTIPGSCPVDPFTPGSYGAAQVVQLNGLLDSCPLISFGAGTYWFDGDLEFKGATALFGAADQATMTCTAGGGETKVMLAADASITHESGRVLICGDLVQSSTVDEGPVLVEATSSDFAPASNLLAGSAETDPAIVPVLATAFPWTASMRANIRAAGQRPMESLQLRWTSLETPVVNGVGSSDRSVKVTFFDAEGMYMCHVLEPSRGRTAMSGSQLELMTDACSTRFAGQPESALDGASVEISFTQNVCASDNGWCTLQLKDVHLVSNAMDIPAESAETESSDPARNWTDPAAALARGGGSTYVEKDCVYGEWVFIWLYEVPDYCKHTAVKAPSTLELSDFSLPDGLSPTDRLTSAVLSFDIDLGLGGAYDGGSNQDFAVTRGQTTALLTDSEGQTCSANLGAYLRSAQTYYADLNGCPFLSAAEDLAGVTAEVTITPERGIYLYPFGLRADASSELPEIDFTRLQVTTNSMDETTSVAVTVDEDNGSSFRVYGKSQLPRADLNVHWNGTATNEALFNGELVVRSASSMQAAVAGSEVGVLCCGPLSPTVRVNAFTGQPPNGSDPGVIRGTARIRLDPAPGGTESDVMVSDWQLCHLGGCVLNDTPLSP